MCYSEELDKANSFACDNGYVMLGYKGVMKLVGVQEEPMYLPFALPHLKEPPRYERSHEWIGGRLAPSRIHEPHDK